jgi:predicted dehydrogenase
LDDGTQHPVRVGLVGCGAQAKEHVIALRNMKYFRVVALCDADQKRVTEAAREWKVDHYYTQFSDMLEKENLSIATIITPPQSHASLIIQAIQRGVNLLVEKPLTTSTSEAESILKNLGGSQVKLTLNYNALFSRVMLRALALVKEGDIGEVLGMEVKMLDPQDDPMTADPNHWAHKLPGGRFGEMLSHPIYLVQSVLGNNLIVENVTPNKRGNFSWMKYDELHIILKSSIGIAHVYCSFNSPRQEMQIEIFGSKKILRIDLENQTLIAVAHRTLSKTGSAKDSLGVSGALIFQTARNSLNYLFVKRGQRAIQMAYATLVESISKHRDLIVTPEMANNTVKISETICNRI